MKFRIFHESTLSALVQADQKERNSYARFVSSQTNGDYTRGAQLYAKLKNREIDDLFGDRDRLKIFMSTKWKFNDFTNEDWDNYWLLTKHCDENRPFQIQALNTIREYLGEKHSHYQYLSDRISCGQNGTQKYGTQNICQRD